MRIANHTTNRTRKGFTLVELLVAAALSILIMFVIATAFQTGLQTLSTLKSLGDMAERLKTAETLLRNDLEAEHFATTGTAGGTAGDDSPGTLRLSDQRYDLAPPSRPPLGGYFQIWQGAGSFFEGNDAEPLLSSRAGAGENHRLSMTVKRTGRSPEGLFSADLSQLTAAEQASVASLNSSDVFGTNRFVSQWAQVDWFLDVTRPSPLNGVPTWPLVRRVRAVGPAGPATVITSAQDTLSVTPGGLLSTLQSLATPGGRIMSGPSATGQFATAIQNASSKVGDDIVITNVTSFEVRPMYGFPVGPGGISPGALDGAFADLPAPVAPAPVAPATFREFDTGLPAAGNNRIRVIAVQIKIRVYDSKNKMSRQTTMVVKL